MPNDLIDEFLSGRRFAVVGASRDRAKFGNTVLRTYLSSGYEVVAVHPRETEIEGVRCVAGVADLPDDVWGVSIVTPPEITETLVAAIAQRGIRRAWLQPGAESPRALSLARELGLSVIAGGPCLMVELDRRGR